MHILLFVLKTIINDESKWDINYVTLKIKPLEKGTDSADSTVFFLPDQYTASVCTKPIVDFHSEKSISKGIF